MASTNKTTNYELSQFLGTDKPAWLADYNSDMQKIDAQMKLNADAASTAQGGATSATSNIGTLSELTTDTKTNLVVAINEVDSNANTAQNTANSANTTANGCRTDLNKFNLTTKTVLTVTSNLGTVHSMTAIQFAADSSNSIFKIYGRATISNLSGTSGNLNVKLGDTSLRPETAYQINNAAMLSIRNSSGTLTNFGSRNIKINTDGSVYIVGDYNYPDGVVVLDGSTGIIDIFIAPCLYFNTDFGDI